jgi:transcription antitermination factor NusG
MRWYCVSANPFQTDRAADTLRSRSFEVLLPKMISLTPKKQQVRTKPLFGVYFFVRFDVTDQSWRNGIWYAPHVKRIMAASAESPTPIRDSYIEALLRRLDDKLCLDMRKPPPPPPLDDFKGMQLSIEAGDDRVWEGLCTDSTEQNVKLLITNIMGGDREVTFTRGQMKVLHAA